MSVKGKPKQHLLFVSPRFLLPADEGGKIRTGQILRGMRGGEFEITLLSPATPAQLEAHREELEALCDRFESWPQAARSRLHGITRLRGLLSKLPIPVRDDRNSAALQLVSRHLATRPDVVVFDFLHSIVLAPDALSTGSVLFTHNVECEIFERHAEVSGNPIARSVWRDQARKMRVLEEQALGRFDRVVAVSERDAARFREMREDARIEVIPTGVDLEFFEWRDPAATERVVFTGALDWPANEDGIDWLLREVWPQVERLRPQAELRVIGRNPPKRLLERAQGLRCEFTGWVEDVREHVAGAGVFVIPLRVGGGTRIKGYEACAAGPALVSTSIGVEGLNLEPKLHFELADDATSFAEHVARLLADRNGRSAMSHRARRHVEENCSFERVAARFTEICRAAAAAGRVET